MLIFKIYFRGYFPSAGYYPTTINTKTYGYCYLLSQCFSLQHTNHLFAHLSPKNSYLIRHFSEGQSCFLKNVTSKILNVQIFCYFFCKRIWILVCLAFSKPKSGHVPLFDQKPMVSLYLIVNFGVSFTNYVTLLRGRRVNNFFWTSWRGSNKIVI
jgi:hypothetical protein